jgi:hypothetical protein
MFRLALALCLASIPIQSAWTDEVYLKDGRVIEGVVTPVAGSDGDINVKTGVGSMVVVQHFTGDRVEKIVYGKSARQDQIDAIAKKRDDLTDASDAEECWTLAQEAKEAGDQVLYRELALETMVRDRQHEDARTALGLTVVRGVAMKANEAAIANGLLAYNGRWVTWSEREQGLALKAQRDEKEEVRREEREKRRATRAAAQAAYDNLISPYSSVNIPYNSRNSPRVVYWATPCPVPLQPLRVGSGLSVQASGGGSHHSWSFNWGG